MKPNAKDESNPYGQRSKIPWTWDSNWEVVLKDGRWAITKFKITGDIIFEHDCDPTGHPEYQGIGMVGRNGICMTCKQVAPSKLRKLMDVLEL